MRHRGVVYDVGLKFTDVYSVEPFNPVLVAHDMKVIAEQLHATAVRIEGEDIERLVIAARCAHDNGLTVYFNPWKMQVGVDETIPYFAEAARAAEALRQNGVDIVFVTGCELTIFTKGFFPGEDFAERVAWFGAEVTAGVDPDSPNSFAEGLAAGLPESLVEGSKKLNEALGAYVSVVRSAFNGPVSYAAGGWEQVDWSLFDIVGVDHYRRGEPAQEYVASLDRHRLGKPLVVMELGCCTYEGAAPRGDGAFIVLQGFNPDGSCIWQDNTPPPRSEHEQADYVEEQVSLLKDADLEVVFVFVFAFPAHPYSEDGARDADRASFALVKHFEQADPRSREFPPWAPKEAFTRLSSLFGGLASSGPSAER